MSKYRHIRKVRYCQDGRVVVTGKAVCCGGVKMPNVLYMKVLRYPYPHAGIVSIGISKAETMPGVKFVMTYRNASVWRTSVPAYRPVMDQHLRSTGNMMAVVSAANNDVVGEALEPIEVEYRQPTPVYDVEGTIRPGALEVCRAEGNIESRGYHYEGNCLLPGSYFEGNDPLFYYARGGDVKKGFEENGAVVEGRVSYDRPSFPGAPEVPFIAAR